MVLQGRLLSIMEIIKEKQTVTVSELCKALGISESTVRRDLKLLEEKGSLIRVHGGATLAQEFLNADERDVTTKSVINVEQKIAIGNFAATLIEDNDIIFIDAGTTTEKLTDAISSSKATFVTNGISHAQKLARKGLDVIMIGGKIKPVTEAVVGARAAQTLAKYNFTKCFLGTNGISVHSGFTTPETEESRIKELAVQNSAKVYILADSSKFSLISAVTFCPIDKACIITDKIADNKYLKAANIKEVI